jgi:hypothetical protein
MAELVAPDGERLLAKAEPCLGGFLVEVIETSSGEAWSSWSPDLGEGAVGFIEAFVNNAGALVNNAEVVVSKIRRELWESSNGKEL